MNKNIKTIYIGGDHASYNLREKIQKYLYQLGYEIIDEGSYDSKPANYAYYSLKVAKNVQKSANSLGIVVCGSGIGVNITANKVKGIKSTLIFSKKTVEYALKNKSNVLAFGSRFLQYKTVVNLLNIFLNIENSNSQ